MEDFYLFKDLGKEIVEDFGSRVKEGESSRKYIKRVSNDVKSLSLLARICELLEETDENTSAMIDDACCQIGLEINDLRKYEVAKQFIKRLPSLLGCECWVPKLRGKGCLKGKGKLVHYSINSSYIFLRFEVSFKAVRRSINVQDIIEVYEHDGGFGVVTKDDKIIYFRTGNQKDDS
jgi:hypothetical protein